MRRFAARSSLVSGNAVGRSASSSFEPSTPSSSIADGAAASSAPTGEAGSASARVPKQPEYTRDAGVQASSSAKPRIVAELYYSPEMESNASLKEKVVQFLMSRDKELFNLKRQHELALLRIEQGQDRLLKEEQSIDVYREHALNVNTFEEVSVSHYTRRGTCYQMLNVADLRKLKVLAWVLVTAFAWVYLYTKYIINPEKEYIAKNVTLYGSNYQAMKQRREAVELAESLKLGTA